MEFDHTVPSGQQTDENSQKNEPIPANLQQMTGQQSNSSSSRRENEQGALNDVGMLIVDKDTQRRRHDEQEGVHHFHALDEGIDRRDREAEQLQTTDRARSATGEEDSEALECRDHELAINQVASSK